ncbi:hypothetical protein SDC9_180574 [bioreactor metagenome]|uniref:Uncharacterized protein n=1 Tax=bioreactor metagenome TaxID=1076179 RepID=A0A645H245_9ZZZZ
MPCHQQIPVGHPQCQQADAHGAQKRSPNIPYCNLQPADRRTVKTLRAAGCRIPHHLAGNGQRNGDGVNAQHPGNRPQQHHLLCAVAADARDPGLL